MLPGIFLKATRWEKICSTFGMASLVILCAIQCDSSNLISPPNADPLAILSPRGGEKYSLTDSLPVRWMVNTDSLNASNIHSYLKQFTLDSGKTWNDMSVKLKSEITDSNQYQITWIVLDTSMFNNATQANFTKMDFLNRDLKLRVVSYPPHSKTGYTGYIHFTE